MSRMFLTALYLLGLLTQTEVKASCMEAYQNEIKKLEQAIHDLGPRPKGIAFFSSSVRRYKRIFSEKHNLLSEYKRAKSLLQLIKIEPEKTALKLDRYIIRHWGGYRHSHEEIVRLILEADQFNLLCSENDCLGYDDIAYAIYQKTLQTLIHQTHKSRGDYFEVSGLK